MPTHEQGVEPVCWDIELRQHEQQRCTDALQASEACLATTETKSSTSQGRHRSTIEGVNPGTQQLVRLAHRLQQGAETSPLRAVRPGVGMHSSESPSCLLDIAVRGPPHTECPLPLGRRSVCGDASEGRGDIGQALAGHHVQLVTSRWREKRSRLRTSRNGRQRLFPQNHHPSYLGSKQACVSETSPSSVIASSKRRRTSSLKSHLQSLRQVV